MQPPCREKEHLWIPEKGESTETWFDGKREIMRQRQVCPHCRLNRNKYMQFTRKDGSPIEPPRVTYGQHLY